MKKNNQYIIWGVVALIVIAGFFVIRSSGSNGEYDEFAQCLTDMGARMYGAYWCPHCKEQKEMFGSSWEYVTYIECSLPNAAGQTEECNREGIQGYPTWEFSDGSRISGTMALQQLSSITGCSLNSEQP